MSISGSPKDPKAYARRLLTHMYVDESELISELDGRSAKFEAHLEIIQSKCIGDIFPSDMTLCLDALLMKFGYTSEQMSAIWPVVRESVLSKRRNTKTKINKPTGENISMNQFIHVFQFVDSSINTHVTQSFNTSKQTCTDSIQN